MDIEQYKIIAARREGFNNKIWQTPTLAIAGQTFLINAALTKAQFAIGFCLLALIVGAATILLMLKLRHMEVSDAKILETFEKRNKGYAVLHGTPETDTDLDLISAFWVWVVVLVAIESFSMFIFAVQVFGPAEDWTFQRFVAAFGSR